MRIGILEDNEQKLQDIVSCLKNHFENIQIDSYSAFSKGIYKLIHGEFDYAILDNNMPQFEDSSGYMVPDAALDAMEFLWLYKKDTKCIVCSSEPFHGDIRNNNYLGAVKYSFNSIDWKKKLISLIEQNEKEIIKGSN